VSERRIFKTVFTVTVLSEDMPISPDTDMEDVLNYINTGDGIGQVELASADSIPADKIEAELLAIGNDGTFFNMGDEDEGDE